METDLLKENGLSTSVGDEGGFAPMISSNEKALDLVVTAINKSGLMSNERYFNLLGCCCK